MLPAPGGALADDDDDGDGGDLRVQVYGLRCYRVATGTVGRNWTEVSGPEGTSLHLRQAMIFRGSGGQTLDTTAFDDTLPLPFPFDGTWGWNIQAESVRLAYAGVEPTHAGAVSAMREAECESVGEREGVEVKLDLFCTRNALDGRRFGVIFVDLVNHESQPADFAVQARLLARFQGSGDDWEELFPGGLTGRERTVAPQSAATMNYQLGKSEQTAGVRRLRVEIDIDVPGRNGPIQKEETANCRGED